MSDMQAAVLILTGCCAVASLVAIWLAIGKLAKSLSEICVELAGINMKLEAQESSKEEALQDSPGIHAPDDSFKDLEEAISNFEKMKRIDAGKPPA